MTIETREDDFDAEEVKHSEKRCISDGQGNHDAYNTERLCSTTRDNNNIEDLSGC